MKLQNFMELLHKELELPDAPVLTNKGSYLLKLDEGMDVTLYEYALMADDPQDLGIALTAVITPCSEKAAPSLTQAALLGNLFGVSTQSSIIGLSANSKHLTLCREIEYNCDYTDFRDILEEFLNTLDLWRATAALHQDVAA